MADKNNLRKAAKATRVIFGIVTFIAGVAIAAVLVWVGYKFGNAIGLWSVKI